MEEGEKPFGKLFHSLLSLFGLSRALFEKNFSTNSAINCQIFSSDFTHSNATKVKSKSLLQFLCN